MFSGTSSTTRIVGCASGLSGRMGESDRDICRAGDVRARPARDATKQGASQPLLAITVVLRRYSAPLPEGSSISLAGRQLAPARKATCPRRVPATKKKAHRSGLSKRDGHRSHCIDADTPQSFQCSPATSEDVSALPVPPDDAPAWCPTNSEFPQTSRPVFRWIEATAALSSGLAESKRVKILPLPAPPPPDTPPATDANTGSAT